MINKHYHMNPNNNFQNNFPRSADEEHNWRLGIILLVVFLVVLIVVSSVYIFRGSDNGTIAENGGAKKAGFFERLLNNTISSGDSALDTDLDGLSDNDEEKKYNTNVAKADTDGDMLTDREEALVYKTDPLKADTDSDSTNDGQEIKDRHNPLDSNPNAEWPPKPGEFASN